MSPMMNPVMGELTQIVRVAIYARYSSNLQRPTSIEGQIDYARRLCEQKGWQVTAVYTDAAVTGRKTVGRDGFLAMIAAAERREFDMIVVEAVDRFSRSVVQGLNHFASLSHVQTRLWSVGEGEQQFLTVMINLLGAQLFSEMIRVHTKRGMTQALENGRLHTSAYGYDKLKVEEGPNRAINPVQAEIVRRIYEAFASGQSADMIARALNAEGVPAPRGGTWDPTTIRGNPKRAEGILNNRLYIGEGSVNKTTRSHHPTTQAKSVRATPDEAVRKDFPELRIIPDPLWDRVQAELARRAALAEAKGNPRAAARAIYVLSGLLVCDCCGARYVFANKSSYQCWEARKGACENKSMISRKRIESRVFAVLREGFLTPATRKAFDKALAAEEARRAKLSPEAMLADLRKAAAKLIVKRKAILRAVAEGAPWKVYQDEANRIEEEIGAIEARISAAEKAVTAAASPPLDSGQLYATVLARIGELLADPEVVEAASGLLRRLITKITLRPDPDAKHGVAAEIHLDLGSLVSAAGYPPEIAAPFTGKRQLTARQGALPPRGPCPLTPGIFSQSRTRKEGLCPRPCEAPGAFWPIRKGSRRRERSAQGAGSQGPECLNFGLCGRGRGARAR